MGALVHAHVPPGAVAIGGPTEYGARRWLEGSAERGDAVVVVEDVITSGSLLDAVGKGSEDGLRVLRAVVLVDREEDGGHARVERALGERGADLVALYARTDIERAWRASR